MSLVLVGSTSGSVTLKEPAVAGTTVLTLPAASGTVMVSGNMPAFSAYKSANQSITSAVATKVTFDTEEFDTNNNFASSTFTPTVAGYYQVNAMIYCVVTAGTLFITSLYKNGSQYKNSDNRATSASNTNTLAVVVYMNGSTDYLEIYQRVDGTTPSVVGTLSASTFSASLIRS